MLTNLLYRVAEGSSGKYRDDVVHRCDRLRKDLLTSRQEMSKLVMETREQETRNAR